MLIFSTQADGKLLPRDHPVGATEARPSGGVTIDFVVESDRAQLIHLVQRVRDGRLRTNIGKVAALDDAVEAFNRTERIQGKTIIRAHP